MKIVMLLKKGKEQRSNPLKRAERSMEMGRKSGRRRGGKTTT